MKKLLISIIALLSLACGVSTTASCGNFLKDEKVEQTETLDPFNEYDIRVEIETLLRNEYGNRFGTIVRVGFNYKKTIMSYRIYLFWICHDAYIENGIEHMPTEYFLVAYDTRTKDIFTKEMTESGKML